MATNSGRITYELIHAATGIVLASQLKAADTWWRAGVGLLGCRTLEAGKGLWLPGVRSVHTFGMRFGIDLLFLDGDFVCTGWMSQVMPGRFVVGPGETRSVVELAVGTLGRVSMLNRGDQFAMNTVQK